MYQILGFQQMQDLWKSGAAHMCWECKLNKTPLWRDFEM